MKIVSATDDALTYRVRRIFYICVCVCVYVIRLWKCVVSIIISHTKNITDVINNSIINNTTKFIIYMHSFVIIHNNLDTRIFIANQQWPPTVVSRFQIKRYVKLECETSITKVSEALCVRIVERVCWYACFAIFSLNIGLDRIGSILLVRVLIINR